MRRRRKGRLAAIVSAACFIGAAACPSAAYAWKDHLVEYSLAATPWMQFIETERGHVFGMARLEVQSGATGEQTELAVVGVGVSNGLETGADPLGTTYGLIQAGVRVNQPVPEQGNQDADPAVYIAGRVEDPFFGSEVALHGSIEMFGADGHPRETGKAGMGHDLTIAVEIPVDKVLPVDIGYIGPALHSERDPGGMNPEPWTGWGIAWSGYATGEKVSAKASAMVAWRMGPDGPGYHISPEGYGVGDQPDLIAGVGVEISFSHNRGRIAKVKVPRRSVDPSSAMS